MNGIERRIQGIGESAARAARWDERMQEAIRVEEEVARRIIEAERRIPRVSMSPGIRERVRRTIDRPPPIRRNSTVVPAPVPSVAVANADERAAATRGARSWDELSLGPRSPRPQTGSRSCSLRPRTQRCASPSRARPGATTCSRMPAGTCCAQGFKPRSGIRGCSAVATKPIGAAVVRSAGRSAGVRRPAAACGGPESGERGGAEAEAMARDARDPARLLALQATSFA